MTPLTTGHPLRILTASVLLLLSWVAFAGATSTMESLLEDSWYRTEWDNVTIISNASRRDTEALARSVADFVDNIGRVLPYPTRADSWPLRIYVCKDKNTFVQLAPPEGKYQENVSGIFTQGLGYDAIVILANAPQSRLRNILFHELVHREMRSLGDIPLWLDEGLAEVFSNFRFKKQWLEYALSDSHHRHWLQRADPTSLARLFHVSNASPEYNELQLSGPFYATSWAFTHYGLFGDAGAHRQVFLEFVDDARKQVVTEALFRRHFNMSYGDMHEKLLQYARSFRFPKPKIERIADAPTPSFAWITEEPELTRLYLAGATTLSRQYDHSRTILDTLSVPSSSTEVAPTLLQTCRDLERATLAFYEQDFESAHRYALDAYEAGDRSPTTLILTAEALLKIIPGQRIFYNTIISHKEVNQAFRCIQKVIEYAPRNALACRLYVLAWLRTNAKPSPDQFETLLQHTRMLPDDSEIAFLTADLMVFHKKYREARSILELFKNHAYSQWAREEVDRRLSNLNPS